MDNLKELGESFKNSPILFIGSGVSSQAGLPSWKELVRWLNSYALSLGCSIDTSSRFIENNKLLDAASEIVHQLKTVEKTLANFFTEYERCKLFHKAEPVEIHDLINKLPTTSYITPNYDLLLEKSVGAEGHTKVVKRGDSESLTKMLHGELNSYIYKYHGCISSPQDIVLTASSYREEIHGQQEQTSSLKTLVNSKTFVFIGAGLDDADFKFIREETIQQRGSGALKVWAFIGDCAGDEEYYEREYGIKLINYNVIRNGEEQDHSDLLLKLEALLKEIEKTDNSNEKASEGVAKESTTLRENGGIVRQALIAANEEVMPIDEQILGFVSMMNGVERQQCFRFLVGFKGNLLADVENRIDYLVNRELIRTTRNYLLPVKGNVAEYAAIGIESDVMDFIAEQVNG